MLPASDPRWQALTGGYKMPLDPRPLVGRLADPSDRKDAWSELWEELHHQGDVGTASYAAVPLLVEDHQNRAANRNVFAIVAIIDLARTEPGNPALPEWLSAEYFAAIDELAKIGVKQLADVNDADTARSILSVLALSKGLRLQAKLLISYTEDELRELGSGL
jgi:hypothetical protein